MAIFNKREAQYFQDQSSITEKELTAQYGELMKFDMICKFGEHQNFTKAKEHFDKLNEEDLTYLDNWLRQEMEIVKTREQYLALQFICRLDNNRLKIEKKAKNKQPVGLTQHTRKTKKETKLKL